MKQGNTGKVLKSQLPTITKFTANPNSGDVPLLVKFHAEAEGGLQPYSEWIIEFEKGKIHHVPNSHGKTAIDIEYIYQSPGPVTAIVTVNDNIGNPSEPSTVQITPTMQPLYINVKANPQSGKAPLLVQFEATYGGGNEAVYKLSADFKDGNHFSESEQRGRAAPITAGFHNTYSKPGQYMPKVCIMDAISNEVCNESITIIVS